VFHAGGSLNDVAASVCAEALDIFGATGAALWSDLGDGIELISRVPHAPIFGHRQRILFSEHPTFASDLEAGQPRFIEDVEHDDPVLYERFGRYSRSRSQLRLPLASAGQARALIVLSWDEAALPPSRAVAAIASRFADQAGVALAEAARRAAQEEANALHARFEESLLPSFSLAARDAGIATFYRPGDERLTLGGDFYDCLELSDGAIGLLIGDVAGHGPAAAALGAGMRTAWRALVLGGWPVEDIPRGLQEVCVREREDQHLFVTAISARLEPDRSALRFVSAGHPAPLLVGSPTPASNNGPPIGVVGDARWEINQVSVGPPATVLLYTDGLVEGRAAPGASERLGIAPIEQRLAGATPGAVGEDDLRELVDLATRANGAGLPDDVALLALNVR
jgi:serine phosphatase RsbU (regulator of sigma subunit)